MGKHAGRFLFCAVLAANAGWTADGNEAALETHIGPVRLLPFGFLEMIGATRSAVTHDDISTRFGSFPLGDGSQESVASLRNSRMALQAEAAAGPGTLSGYLETDFLNRPPQQPFRFRQYFAQYTLGDWDFSGGQEWSVLRPSRAGISTIVGLMNTRVVDAGYHVGLLGYRNRQVRVRRRAGSWQAAMTWENGRDFLPKIAHDSARLHWEVTGIAGVGGHHGASAAAIVHAGRRVDVVTQQSWIRGAGRDALGTVATAARAVASLAGIEARLTRDWQAFAYAGLVRSERAPGNRQVSEWTLGFNHIVSRDRIGPMVLSAQVSQLDRSMWDGPRGGMRFAMISLRHYLGAPQ